MDRSRLTVNQAASAPPTMNGCALGSEMGWRLMVAAVVAFPANRYEASFRCDT